MKRKFNFIENITILFVFVMTFLVCFTISKVQSENIELIRKDKLLFVIGFGGSIICIILRFVLLYYKTLQQSRKIKKVGVMIYLIVWSLLAVIMLGMVLRLSEFSLEQRYLSNYNAYQIFMLVIVFAQWIAGK